MKPKILSRCSESNLLLPSHLRKGVNFGLLLIRQNRKIRDEFSQLVVIKRSRNGD